MGQTFNKLTKCNVFVTSVIIYISFFFVLINDKQNTFQVNYYSGLSYLDGPKVKGQKEENSDKTGNKAIAEPVTEQVGNNSTHSEKQVEKSGQWVPRKEKTQSIYEIMRLEGMLQSLLTMQNNVAVSFIMVFWFAQQDGEAGECCNEHSTMFRVICQ